MIYLEGAMNHDMLWQVDGSLLKQIPMAVRYFTKKYGHRPTICQGNIRELSNAKLLGSIVAGIEITAGAVLQGHIKVGHID